MQPGTDLHVEEGGWGKAAMYRYHADVGMAVYLVPQLSQGVGGQDQEHLPSFGGPAGHISLPVSVLR